MNESLGTLEKAFKDEDTVSPKKIRTEVGICRSENGIPM